MSLITSGSSTVALLGALKGVRVEVTQDGVGPVAFVATQPDGKAGATTPSKFWAKAVPHGLGVGVSAGVPVAVAVAVAVAVGVAAAVEVAVGVPDGVGVVQPARV